MDPGESRNLYQNSPDQDVLLFFNLIHQLERFVFMFWYLGFCCLMFCYVILSVIMLQGQIDNYKYQIDNYKYQKDVGFFHRSI